MGTSYPGYKTDYEILTRKLYFNSLTGVSIEGFSGKCTIAPISADEIRFKSPTPVFYNGDWTKRVDISQNSDATIYPDDSSRSAGIRISTESPDPYGGMGGFSNNLW